MPKISLVICAYGQRKLLERLLQKCQGIFDDLVVVHDGPDFDGIESIVEKAKGRFYARERAWQQEPHWPFAWEKAAHDWILRLDVDEYPSEQLKEWLVRFHQEPEPQPDVSGYTCIWPLWDGKKSITYKWPTGRLLLLNRQRVRFFGMVEHTPQPDGKFIETNLVLEHQPSRKSYGVANLLFRKQAYDWRRVIARSLVGKPTDLACWRWTDEEWPAWWRQIRERPLLTGVKQLLLAPLRQARQIWRAEHRIIPDAVIGTGLHPFLIAITYFIIKHFGGSYGRK
jgi:glycosyltransferase involved in cell wall biosynthesis